MRPNKKSLNVISMVFYKNMVYHKLLVTRFILINGRERSFWWFLKYLVWNTSKFLDFGKLKHDLCTKKKTSRVKYSFLVIPEQNWRLVSVSNSHSWPSKFFWMQVFFPDISEGNNMRPNDLYYFANFTSKTLIFSFSATTTETNIDLLL
jgi:hypothetical protein